MLSALRKGEYEGLQARLDGTDTLHTDATMLPDKGAASCRQRVAKSVALPLVRDRSLWPTMSMFRKAMPGFQR